MHILLIHSFYQQFGGEDISFQEDVLLLRENGHSVTTYVQHNAALKRIGKVKSAALTVWNVSAYKKIRSICNRNKPDIAHIHNIFPLISPSVLYALRAEKIPIVMTLHNYRLFCVNALLYRNNGVCDKCLGKLPWRSIPYRCYRGFLESMAVTLMITVHRMLKTWCLVDNFIALTDFAKSVYLRGGLDDKRIRVESNYLIKDPGPKLTKGGYAIFVGRLTPEKGVRTIIKAWDVLEDDLRLLIFGGGPLLPEIICSSASNPNIEVLGTLELNRIFEFMDNSLFMIFPSEWYECMPRVILESFAKGLPIITSSIGAQGTLVKDGYTGLHFKEGDFHDLAVKIKWAIQHSDEMRVMGMNARQEYINNFSKEHHHQRLLEIYTNIVMSKY